LLTRCAGGSTPGILGEEAHPAKINMARRAGRILIPLCIVLTD